MDGAVVPPELRFRRQFLLTDTPLPAPPAPLQATTLGTWHLYRHPDLPLTVLDGETGPQLALLGFVLDPDRPEATDYDILSSLAAGGLSPAALARGLHRLSGRFVLLVFGAEGLCVFHDPCGLRTVYYRQIDGHLAIGSSPPILGLVAPLTPGARARDYWASDYVRGKREHWLPCGTSLYEEVQQLVPNHYLRAGDLAQIRYWPFAALAPRALPEAADRIARILSQSITAMGRRGPLAFPITAGLDSRTLLAATKAEAAGMYFYTLRYRKLDEQSADIQVPRRLLGKLGLRHHLIDCRTEAPADFAAIYETNTAPSHMDDWGQIAHGMLQGLPQDRVAIKGNCSEVGRCQLYPSGHADPHPDAEAFAGHYFGWKDLLAVREGVNDWLSGTRPVAESFGFNLLDLFHWEVRQGGWQAQSQLEWDIAQEVFTPFNNREVLELMLGVDPRHRIGPDHEIYREIALRLWPEVLSEPINPKPPEPAGLSFKRLMQGLKRRVQGRS